MGIALPGLLSTAMARQHLNLFAMWFAGGGVTQIFRMPRGRKQRFTHDRAQSCAIALRSPASERPSDLKRIFTEYSPPDARSPTLSRRPRESESEGRLPPLQLEGVAGGGRAEPGRVDAGRATRGGDRRLGHTTKGQHYFKQSCARERTRRPTGRADRAPRPAEALKLLTLVVGLFKR